MTAVIGHVDIGCPVEDVFDFVADERNEPAYNPGLLRASKLTPGPVGAGTRFAALHRSRGRPVEMLVELTEYERPRRLRSYTTMPGGEVLGELTFELLDHGTRLRWAWDVRPKHLGWLLAPVVRAIGSRQERACWVGLKRYLEQPALHR